MSWEPPLYYPRPGLCRPIDGIPNVVLDRLFLLRREIEADPDATPRERELWKGIVEVEARVLTAGVTPYCSVEGKGHYLNEKGYCARCGADLEYER